VAVKAILALALLAALGFAATGCGASKKAVVSGNPSNNTSVCAYTKRVGKGRVYVEIAVTPVSQEPTACSAFNRTFGGRKMPPDLPRGTGRPHCGYTKRGSSYTIKLGVFASPHTGTGIAFCRSFDPGHGFRRDF
jgi:hypothetical protein